jgi:hypothetical protein
MEDVFASVYNFHSPLSSKVKLSILCGCNLRFLISRCWATGSAAGGVFPCSGVNIFLPEDGRTTETCSSIIV